MTWWRAAKGEIEGRGLQARRPGGEGALAPDEPMSLIAERPAPATDTIHSITARRFDAHAHDQS